MKRTASPDPTPRRRARRGAALAALLLLGPAPALLLLGPAPALAGALPAPGSEAWRPLEFRSIERHTRYRTSREDGAAALVASSECSASALLLPLADVDLAMTPRLRWRWKVVRPIESGANERAKQGDDFAARVYVSFAFVPERASLLEAARHRVGALLYGENLPGSAISYVWSRAAGEGEAWDNPFVASSKMVSLGPGRPAEWRTAEVDVLADYRRLFGVSAPRALFVAIMTDTDNTCGRAEALYADFELLP